MSTLSVIVPVFNEEEILEQSIFSIKNSLDGLNLEYEIILIDDGSRDGTGEICDSLSKKIKEIRVYHHRNNRGLGAVVRNGIENSHNELIIISPIDSPLELYELKRFIDAIQNSDMAIGYRTKRPGYSFIMRTGSKLMNILINKLFGLRIKDFNWIHLYRRNIFETIKIESNGIFYLAEVVIKASYAGFKINQVPAEMRLRTTGVSTIRKPKVIIKTLINILSFWFRTRVKEFVKDCLK